MNGTVLCTVEDVNKQIASNTGGYLGDLPRTQQAILLAGTMISEWLGRKMDFGVYTDTFPCPRMTRDKPFRLYTSGIPVDPNSIVSRHRGVLLTDELALIDPAKGILELSTYSERQFSLSVSYSAGYLPLTGSAKVDSGVDNHDLLDVPYALRMATAIQAAYLASRSAANQTGEQSSGTKAAQQSAFSITPDATKLIASMKRPRYRGV